MDDSRATDGVEHLQAAARELLSAARAFLDVVEEVVEDSDRLNGAAATVTDFLRSGFARPGPQPWAEAAWDGDETDWDEDATDRDDLDEVPGDEVPGDEVTGDDGPDDGPADQEPPDDEAPDDEAPDDEAPAVAERQAARPRTTSRVRRIAVD